MKKRCWHTGTKIFLEKTVAIVVWFSILSFSVIGTSLELEESEKELSEDELQSETEESQGETPSDVEEPEEEIQHEIEDVPAADECAPKCSSGYTCKQGECKGPCDPECQSFELCTGNGHCIPKNLTQKQELDVSNNGREQGFIDDEYLKYNEVKYVEFENKHKRAVTLIVTGSSFIAIGIGLLTLKGIKYDGTEADKPLTIISPVMMGMGVLLIGRGALLVKKSRIGMKKAKMGEFHPELDPEEFVKPDSKKKSSKVTPTVLPIGFRF